MSFTYSYAGRLLYSTIPLAGLRPGVGSVLGAPIHLSLDLGETPDAGPTRCTWPGAYGLSLRAAGEDWLFTSTAGNRYQISADGGSIRCSCVGDSGNYEFSDVLVRRILPRIPLLVDATLLHAAALSTDSGGILIAGFSGAGKSTLSAALSHLAGWTILSDDLSILRQENGPFLYPGAPGVCVWNDSQQALNLQPESCRSMPGYDGKIWYAAGAEAPPPCAVPLRAFISLARSDECLEPQLQPLSRSDAFIHAMRQLILFDPSDYATSRLPEHVARLGRIIESVPAYSLVYPGGYRAVPEIDTLLRALLR